MTGARESHAALRVPRREAVADRAERQQRADGVWQDIADSPALADDLNVRSEIGAYRAPECRIRCSNRAEAKAAKPLDETLASRCHRRHGTGNDCDRRYFQETHRTSVAGRRSFGKSNAA